MKVRHSRGQRGLTLLELLLTMVIFALVIGVFSQALFQMARFERAFNKTTGMWQQLKGTGLAASDWVQSATLLGARPDGAISGASQRWESDAMANWPGLEGQLARLVLQIEPDSSGQWAMLASFQPLGQQALGAGLNGAVAAQWPSRIPVARWPKAVRMEYVDARGQASDRWPVQAAVRSDLLQTQVLPYAIRVVSTDGQLMQIWRLQGAAQRVELVRNPASGISAQATGEVSMEGAYAN